MITMEETGLIGFVIRLVLNGVAWLVSTVLLTHTIKFIERNAQSKEEIDDIDRKGKQNSIE
jgi:hypothetical protein